MTLKLINNLDKSEQILTVSDIGSGELFYKFNISLPSGMADGEYTYELYDGEDLKATGLVQIGNYNNNKKRYTNSNGKYKQYNG